MRMMAHRFFVFAVASNVLACSADPATPRSAVDESDGETTADQEPSAPSMSHDAGASGSPVATEAGAGSSARPDASWRPDAANSVVSSSETTTVLERDASVILDPEVEELAVAELCERIGNLEGESVDVDLTAELSQSNWIVVASASVDAGASSTSDAMACEARFAAYVVPCSGSVLVITAPTFAFGEGPLVGGEPVGFGCWEAGCDAGCLPESVAGAGKVRGRVTAPVNPRYDEGRAIAVGDVRVNGVDVEGIAQLEVLERL